MTISKPTGIRRICLALKNSFAGFKAILANEAAFRQELVLFIPLTVIAFLVAKDTVELVLLIAVLWLVLIVEIINSAIEAVVDRIGLEHHQLSGLAKDLGSLAVLFSLLLALFVWLALLL